MTSEWGRAVRERIGALSASVWQTAVLQAALESGLLLRLSGEPVSLDELASEAEGRRVIQAELDVLSAMELVVRSERGWSLAPGLAELIADERGEILAHELRATVGQAAELVRMARAGAVVPGWVHIDSEILTSQGRGSLAAFEPIACELVPSLPGAAEALAREGAAILDVGAGVAAGSIVLARRFPAARVVGLEPAPMPLALARTAIEREHLEDRIELRAQRVEHLADREAFDVAWLPQVFLRANVYASAIERILRALRPGGWLVSVTGALPGASAPAALSRLRTVLMGGDALTAEEAAAIASERGLSDVELRAPHPGTPYRVLVARKPR